MVYAQKTEYGRGILIVAGSLAAIFLSGLLDYGVDQMHAFAQRSFQMIPYLWATTVANLLSAFILLLLGWLVFRTRRHSRLIGAILLLLGLLVIAYPLLFFHLRLGLSLALAQILAPAGTRLSLTAAFVAVLGAFQLLRPE